MPVFHTKTIESILEPVAQQVSRLVILHEEAEDGNAMPDLSRPVQAVSKAVTNLVKVGRDTINSSDDSILKQDMPSALHRVEDASKLLEEASAMLKMDPYSGPARKKLIEGSRGILQGTSSLLLCFDESEVRKIIRECKKVLDYLAVAEVIETMEDLVQFLKDLSPCLSRVSREVGAREKELTHQVHREILIRCLDQVKSLAPILICSMKIFIHIISQGGRGGAEAAENRNYLTARMTEELHEIIRVLQLTTYDEDEWDADNLTVMKKAHNAIQSKIRTARDWLLDPLAMRGGIGEKSLRQILNHASEVADRCLPNDRDAIKKMISEVTTMVDALCELRDDGKGTSPQAEGLARGIEEKLQDLNKIVSNAVTNMEKSGGQQPAHTVTGRLEQAQRWLSHPERDDRGLGQRAIALIIAEGKKVADGLPGIQRAEILSLCDEVDYLSNQLNDLCRRGLGNSPKAQEIAKLLSQKLHELKDKIQDAVVNRVVEDFVDIVSPLKHFTEAVHVLEGTPGREANFDDKARYLSDWSRRAAKTGKMVAAGGSGGNKKLAEALLNSANQLDSLTPQVVNAGRIRMNYPDNRAAEEHFDNLRTQYADTVGNMRNLCDEATDSALFVKISEEQMRKHALMCEDAIAKNDPNKMVDHTTAIARLANRVLQVAKQEADNSEDPSFIASISRAADQLQSAVAPMVQDAKSVALNTRDAGAASRWRESNKRLLNAVGNVRKTLTLPGDLNGLQINDTEDYSKIKPEKIIKPQPVFRDVESRISPPRHYRSDLFVEKEVAPPRPPLPGGEVPPPRPPPPETDDEDDIFMHAPLPNQPILAKELDTMDVVYEVFGADDIRESKLSSYTATNSRKVKVEYAEELDAVHEVYISDEIIDVNVRQRKRPAYTTKALSEIKNKNLMECDVCGLTLSSKSNFMRHWRTKHGGGIPKIFECPECHTTFKRKDILKRHTLMKHETRNLACNMCGKKFLHERHLQKHMDSHTDTEKFLECAHCSSKFSKNILRIEHIRRCHPDVNISLPKITRLRCLKCGDIFKRRQELNDHYTLQHHIELVFDKLVFSSLQHYEEWYDKMKLQTITDYVIQQRYKTTSAASTLQLICHRSRGYSDSPMENRKRQLKKKGLKGLDGYCPAEIKVTQLHDGTCHVVYQKTHVGHAVGDRAEWKHIYLTEAEKLQVAAKIYSGVPKPLIWKQQLLSPASENGFVTRLDLLSRKDVHNVAAQYRIDFENGEIGRSMDLRDCEAFVEQNQDVVLFCKRRGEPDITYETLDKEDFALVLMDESRAQCLRRCGSRAVAMDATRKTNPYGFLLYTLLVLDDEDESCEGNAGTPRTTQALPVAFCLTNRMDQTGIDAFLLAVRSRVGPIKSHILISDMRLYDSWSQVMQPPEMHLFCSWHVREAWKQNFARVEAKEKRSGVKEALLKLANERNVLLFEKKFADFLGQEEPDLQPFLSYVRENYSSNTQRWACCFRDEAAIVANTHVEAWLRTFQRTIARSEDVRTLYQCLVCLRECLTLRLAEIRVRGEVTAKLATLQNRHRSAFLSFNGDEPVDVTPIDSSTFLVSASPDDSYTVCRNEKKSCELESEDAACELECTLCNICYHEYQCSCPDASIKNNMCEHIHVLGLWLQTPPPQQSDYTDQTDYSDYTLAIDHTDDTDQADQNDLPEVIIVDDVDESISDQADTCESAASSVLEDSDEYWREKTSRLIHDLDSSFSKMSANQLKVIYKKFLTPIDSVMAAACKRA